MSDEKRLELEPDKLENAAGGASYVDHYWIDAGNCYYCGACYGACPALAVYDTGSSYAISASGCVGCGQCVPVCPSGAIHPA